VAHHVLLRAGARAGLRVGMLSCQDLVASRVLPGMVDTLAAPPIRLTWRRDLATPEEGYCITARGMPATAIQALVAAVGGTQRGCNVQVVCSQGDCRPKTAAVLAEHLAA